jgi:hypothetical protein
MKTRFEWILHPCCIGACVILLAPALAGADEGRSGNGNGGAGGSNASGGGANQNSAAAGPSSTNGSSTNGTSSGGASAGGGSLGDKSRGRDTWSDKADNRDRARCEASQLCARSANARHVGGRSNGYETADGSPSPVGEPMNLLPVRFHGTFRPVNQTPPIPSLKGGKAVTRPVAPDPQVTNSGIGAQQSKMAGARNSLESMRSKAAAPSELLRISSSEKVKGSGTEPRLHATIPPMKRTAALTVQVPPPQYLTLDDDNGDVVRDCAGKDVTIRSNNAKFILTGGCRSVTVSGNNNKVLAEVAADGKVASSKQSNLVAWVTPGSSADPNIFSIVNTISAVDLSHDFISHSLQKQGNLILAENPPGVSSAPATEGSSKKAALSYISESIPKAEGELIIIAESNARLIRDCANKDVAVSGSGSDLVLTGGCRSVTVSGNGNKIIAEIGGGGELTILHSRNAAAWTRVGASSDPVAIHAEPTNRTLELIR